MSQAGSGKLTGQQVDKWGVMALILCALEGPVLHVSHFTAVRGNMSVKPITSGLIGDSGDFSQLVGFLEAFPGVLG